MKELSKSQRLMLLDLVEAIVDDVPIQEEILKDLHVVFQFLKISKDTPNVVFQFIQSISIDQLCYLTRMDVVSEELILELHCSFGLPQTQLVQWLRGIGYGGFSFFIDQAREREVLHLDSMILQSRTSHHMVDGVFIDSIQIQFPSLNRLVDFALSKRIPFHQYRDILTQMSFEQADVDQELQRLIDDYQVFSPIRSSKQVLPFRVFCSFFDFFSDKPEYLTAISQVFDQLFEKTSVKKMVTLLNDFPYPVIQYMLRRYVKHNVTQVVSYLNESVRDFHYGAIRKIVRRDQLNVNYSYE